MKAFGSISAISQAVVWIILVSSFCAANPLQYPNTKDHFLTDSDFGCKSGHRNPVLFLHGLTANFRSNKKGIEKWLQTRGYCTFSLTYGAFAKVSFLGGIKPLNESSMEVARFIKKIHQCTGATKNDIVGHSEGAIQVLYTAKFGDVTQLIDHVIAIAPPTHGITIYGIYFLIPKAIRTKGLGLITKVCGACTDMIYNSPAVRRLNKGGVAQPGNNVTIIASHFDQGVTPPAAASFINETNVHSIYVQDYCPDDHVGHFGESFDYNVYNLVLNSFQNRVGRKFPCSKGGGILK